MKKITLQDIFDAAWQAFIVEGKPPAATHYGCEYLTDDGRKCAVGLVLPDGHPAQKSGCEVSILIEEYPELWADEISKVDIVDFQNRLHDDLVDFVYIEWKAFNLREKYLQVAKDFNLTVPE